MLKTLAVGALVISFAIGSCAGVKYRRAAHSPEFVLSDVEIEFKRMERKNPDDFAKIEKKYRDKLSQACTVREKQRLHDDWDRDRAKEAAKLLKADLEMSRADDAESNYKEWPAQKKGDRASRYKRRLSDEEILFAADNYESLRCQNRQAKASNRAADRQMKGLRFYSPSPYLLVHSDGRGGLQWEIHHLPDPSKKMSAKPYNFFSTLQYTLNISETDQVMTSATEDGDSTAVPLAVLGAVKTALPAIKTALFNEVERAKSEHRLPTPYLYKIVTMGDETVLIGAQGDVEHIGVEIDPARLSKAGAGPAPAQKGGN